MKDSIINGTGNSRFLKSAISEATTWEQFKALLLAGTLPIDLNGINPSGFQQLGDALNKANLLKDTTAALFGLDTTAVPDEVFAMLSKITKNLLIRDLQIMLNQSLGTSNIDAWSDLLDNTDNINLTESSDSLIFTSGKVYIETPSDLFIDYFSPKEFEFGDTTNTEQVAQSFITDAGSGGIESIQVELSKDNSPTDSVVCDIYTASGDSPDTLLYTSDNEIPASSLTTSLTEQTFNFTNANLSPNTKYCFVVRRTGALNSTNSFNVGYATIQVYSDGRYSVLDNGVWDENSSGYDLVTVLIKFKQPVNQSVVWNPVTATEEFVAVAISAFETLNTGTIEYYLSDDGVNWVEITSLDLIQNVNFSGKDVYLKATLNGDSELSAIAWGGY